MKKVLRDRKNTIDLLFTASCHGVEKIIPMNSSELRLVDIYARANDHRRVIYGTLTLDKDVYKGLLRMLDEGMEKEVWELIKDTESFALPKSRLTQFKRFMKQIPNDILDPYWSPPEEETGKEETT